ncbi:MAG: MATE family efflux transporter, partial [Rheinheimera sp.]
MVSRSTLSGRKWHCDKKTDSARAAAGFSLQWLLSIVPQVFMSAVQSAKIDMTQGDIRQILTRMTIPMLFGMITLMSFNLVDTFFISMLGTHELAAVSFTFPVTFTVISLAIGLSIGTSALIAK